MTGLPPSFEKLQDYLASDEKDEDLAGRLVGINTAIYSPGGSGGNIGIGFAIPANMVRSIMREINASLSCSRSCSSRVRSVFSASSRDIPEMRWSWSRDSS